MSDTFVEYMDPCICLEDRLRSRYEHLALEQQHRDGVAAYLAVLQQKDMATYRHSIRVALVASDIGRFTHLEEKALFYAGLLHDVGKSLTDLRTLQKTDGWTQADSEEIMSHVMDGYRLLRGRFDYSAEVILWHHRFQRNGYPKVIPPPLHEYCEGTRVVIAFTGRMLSLADHYDAVHRINSSSGRLSGEEMKAKMLALNPDQKKLVEDLYEAGIFTTKTF